MSPLPGMTQEPRRSHRMRGTFRGLGFGFVVSVRVECGHRGSRWSGPFLRGPACSRAATAPGSQTQRSGSGAAPFGFRRVIGR